MAGHLWRIKATGSAGGNLLPSYSVDGETDPEYWGYTPHHGEKINSDIECNFSSNGFRLPTNDEWKDAANGGESHAYSGSDNLDEVGWYSANSNNVTHPVAEKMANGYGLYDMSGNVWEWVWGSSQDSPDYRYNRGGGYRRDEHCCGVSFCGHFKMNTQFNGLGFRLLRPLD